MYLFWHATPNYYVWFLKNTYPPEKKCEKKKVWLFFLFGNQSDINKAVKNKKGQRNFQLLKKWCLFLRVVGRSENLGEGPVSISGHQIIVICKPFHEWCAKVFFNHIKQFVKRFCFYSCQNLGGNCQTWVSFMSLS